MFNIHRSDHMSLDIPHVFTYSPPKLACGLSHGLVPTAAWDFINDPSGSTTDKVHKLETELGDIAPHHFTDEYKFAGSTFATSKAVGSLSLQPCIHWLLDNVKASYQSIRVALPLPKAYPR